MYRSHPVRLSVASLALVLAGACADQSPVAPTHSASSSARRDINPASLTWSNEITGTTADGAQYAIYVPTGWNGDVVFYAHGIIPPQAPVGLPQPGQDWDNAAVLRDALGQAGFAIAYSSFGENGYAIKDGIQRTHQLRGIFTSKVGRPNRAFLIGHSLGSQVVQALAESYPGQYNGALAMCGVLGGTKLQTDYVGHTRALFDVFYAGALPGDAMSMPQPIDPVAIQNAALAAIFANQNLVGPIAFADQVQLAGNNGLEWVTSLVNALVYHALGVNDLLARTHGHFLFDNDTTVYTSSVLGSAPYVLANQVVGRFTATPDALAWLANNYEPTGDLRIPMITFHKQRDRLVPFRHEAAYLSRVVAAGETGNLLQRSKNEFGHCERDVADVMKDFSDLVQWANTGVKPQ
jgi:pimeloyl-ACP methyl ester carboxylesterase